MGKDPKLTAMERIIQQAIGEGRVLGRSDDPAREAYPTLWEWLTRLYIGRDHVKQPATLTIRMGPEGILVTLTDRDLAVSFDVATPHLDGALAAMEAALSGPTPPMRSWGKREPQLRKRRGGG